MTNIDELIRSANAGSAKAQHNLGLMYAIGYGVDRDYKKAVDLYRLAAEKNYAPAQNSLGVMYLHGLGVPQDHAKAAHWCRLAQEQWNRSE